jgi:hypothetical protein
MGPVDDFIKLFDGNRMAIGLEEGGCQKLPTSDHWHMAMVKHLTGEQPPIGVYPMCTWGLGEGDWAVHWGCIDFDEGEEESWPHAVNVRAVLEQFGITAWIERSRSKGFHVWVFASEWVVARTMRRALLAACQLVGAPTKEINPKQEELTEGQLGNYVRLPYPGHMGHPEAGPNARRVMVSAPSGVSISLPAFVMTALQRRTNEEELQRIADLFVAPKRPVLIRDIPLRGAQRDGVRSAVDSVDRLSGLAYTILTEGPKDGVDRSTTLWKLATRIHDDGTHTFEEALDIMVQADLAWGKFMDRPNGEAELTRMLEKIWDFSD